MLAFWLDNDHHVDDDKSENFFHVARAQGRLPAKFLLKNECWNCRKKFLGKGIRQQRNKKKEEIWYGIKKDKASQIRIERKDREREIRKKYNCRINLRLERKDRVEIEL